MISKVELRTVKVNSFWNSMHKIIWVKLVLKQNYQNWDNQNSKYINQIWTSSQVPIIDYRITSRSISIDWVNNKDNNRHF